MSKHYDVIVIGSGNAGMGVAGVTRAAGKSVAMVESWDVGGTCAIRGCVPKKVLVAAAQVMHQIERAPEHHIDVAAPKLDWGALIARERGFVEGVPEAFEKSLKDRGIDLYRGRGSFTGRNTVEVVNGSGSEVLEADKIVIATGSKPRPLDLPGAAHLITSDDILEMTALPESLIFIGGGVIALEFAHVFARAGTKVTILEALPRLLPRMDADAVAQLHKESERIGIDILTGVEVASIAEAGNLLEVTFKHEGTEKTLTAERVANGTGRIADLEDLNLEAGEVAHDGLRITVDETLRSVSNPNVYVAGDAHWSSAQLSPIATYEGRLVGQAILDGTGKAPSYREIPSNVYSVPALASVGLTETEAQEQGLAVEVKTTDMTAFRSAMTHAETVAWSKVLLEKDSGKIVGAHMVGHGSEEVIHLFAFAIKHGITAGAMADTVYAYPTFSSDLKFMIQ